jgi:penicillin-binding protein 2
VRISRVIAFLLAAGCLVPVAAFVSVPVAASIEQTVSDAMEGLEGTVLVVAVESGDVIFAHEAEASARRVVSPGSIIKPFTLLALVNAGIVDEQTAEFCPRTVRVGGRNLDCSHPVGLEAIDAVAALAASCNHFFVHHSTGLAPEILYREFLDVGFNESAGLIPNESPGRVELAASPEDGQLMSVGLAQVGVTPAGVAAAYRRLALRLKDPRDDRPGLGLVREGLKEAVRSGTARLAASPNADVAGKTGTADGHAWFAGFAPADRPEIVVVVFLEDGSGGRDAAPIAGRVFAAFSPAGDGP